MGAKTLESFSLFYEELTIPPYIKSYHKRIPKNIRIPKK